MATNTNEQTQQLQKKVQELTVVKSELTGGDTSGLVYVRPSAGAAFMVTSRSEALKGVQEQIGTLRGR